MELDRRTEIVQGIERPLLRKWALSPAGILTLAREADRLQRARHPGVVVLADAAEDHLDLEWAGAETLALARLTRGSAARIVTVVAATLADLHDVGIVHGRIDESHVVIGPDLQPRLCGLRGADPGRAEPGPADDVADLGLLLQRCIGMGADHDVVPENRWRAWPRSSGRDRALEAVGERATDPDPARRPTARALARSLADIVPDVVGERSGTPTSPNAPMAPSPPPSAPVEPEPFEDPQLLPRELPQRAQPAKIAEARLMVRVAASPSPAVTRSTPPNPPPGPLDEPVLPEELGQTGRGQDAAGGHESEPVRRHAEVASVPVPRRISSVRVAAGIALLVLAGAALTLREPSAGGSDPPVPSTPASASSSVGRAASIVSGAPPSTSAPASDERSLVYAVDGNTVELGGSTYQVGESGDRVAVADWDCDGAASAGLVRPSTGEVFVFDGWPSSEPVTVQPRARIARARDLVGTPPGPGCRSPEVRLDDGTSVALLTETGG